VDGSDPDARRAAASYLQELLQRPGTYRRLWERHVLRSRPGQVNQLAVAEVLAQHLWSYPRGPGDDDVLPHQLKDTVSRALSGRLLSRPTLSLFIEAFSFPDAEADRLWRLWSGSAAISLLSGPRALPPKTEQDVTAALGPRKHRTVSLHDHMQVGPDQRPAQMRTLQVIEAIAADVSQIPYMYDTNALTLEVGQGCQGMSGELYQVGAGIFATQIILARSLALGETATLEYWTTFRYDEPEPGPRDREFRRGVLGRMENLDMRVEFCPERLPAAVWWARWDGIGGDVLEQEAVTLDSQHSAHRYLRSIERTLVGFYWR
jgi:hypothetical protein